MGPNPIKLEEELMQGHTLPAGSVVCDLGSGQGLTSVFLAKEYGFTVYAADLWSAPEENRQFFRQMGVSDSQIIPVKADATALPFEKDFFDAVISTDSYNYFGRDPAYLDAKLLLSWTAEQLDYMHDVPYWRAMVEQCCTARVLTVEEMQSNEEVWADWLRQENEYTVGDRKSMEAGGGKYLNFIKIVLQKKG